MQIPLSLTWFSAVVSEDLAVSGLLDPDYFLTEATLFFPGLLRHVEASGNTAHCGCTDRDL